MAETVVGEGLAGKRLVIAVNVDWFFLSHRLPIALAAAEAGAEVVVVADDTGCGREIEGHGLRFEPFDWRRGFQSAALDGAVIARAAALYRRVAPDLIHHVTIKPVIYGSIAARMARPRVPIVNAVSGLGHAFSADPRARRFGWLIERLYRFVLRSGRNVVILQNEDDAALLTGRRIVKPASVVLIRGSGVDLDAYCPGGAPDDPPVVLFPARLLREKGAWEFAAAAEALRASWPDVRFVYAGSLDPDSPTSLTSDEVDDLRRRDNLELWGHVTDMVGAYRAATLVVLPSYREGLPKSLIEAAACGRPIVTTDVPGCRDVVVHERTGLLVAPQDPAALAVAVDRLLSDPEGREEMGKRGRVRAEEVFGVQQVVDATMQTYQRMLARTTS